MKNILIIQGHPDPADSHFGHALAYAYLKGAQAAQRETRLLTVASLEFDVLRTKQAFDEEPPGDDILKSQEDIEWADHLVLFYPLWLGTMPALTKAFFEQVFRPGFAFSLPNGENQDSNGGLWKKMLAGKSAHIVVTMGMPVVVYKWFFRAHGLKNLERNILSFCGVKPVTHTLIGMVDSNTREKNEKHIAHMRVLGQQGR